MLHIYQIFSDENTIKSQDMQLMAQGPHPVCREEQSGPVMSLIRKNNLMENSMK